MKKKTFLIFTITLVLIAMFFISSRTTLRQRRYDIDDCLTSNCSPVDLETDANVASNTPPLLPFNAATILRKGNGILFMETTDRMEPPSLVLCAIESAARVYPDRPVVFFMKGLEDISSIEDEKKTKEHFPTLASFQNIYLFPIRMEKLFINTPLLPWFKKGNCAAKEFIEGLLPETCAPVNKPGKLKKLEVDPYKEVYWTHVSSDACRLASIWKYGGIYMDTDIISLRPIPHDNFLAAQTLPEASNGVFGLTPSHPLAWQFMEDFVKNYRGDIWGHQGPKLFTRVMKKLCGISVINSKNNVFCNKIHYLHPQRFYPIICASWRKYFEVWPEIPTFNNSYGLHLWNFMNKKRISMIPGTNTLVEHVYQQQCPTTYDFIVRNKKTHL